MASPILNTDPLSELIKAKVASLIEAQLRPVVHELEAQHQMLLSHTALLKHNHNVNDFQMGRLENLRDLEQSINHKMTRALRHDPLGHPNMGTDLREPIPADPRLMPQFKPIENATPAERAAESAALIAEAGKSAQHLGVPLTLQDFPRDPAIHGGAEKENFLCSSVPLYGLNAPRWRQKEGLPALSPLNGYYDVVMGPRKKPDRRSSASFANDPLLASMQAKSDPKFDAYVDAKMLALGYSPTMVAFSKASSRRRAAELENGPETAGPSNSTFTTEFGSASAPPVFASSSSSSIELHTTTTTTTITKKGKKKGKASNNNKSRLPSDMEIDEALAPPIPVIVEPSTSTTTITTTGTSRKRSRQVAEIEEDTPNDDLDPTVPVASGPTPAPAPKRGSKTQRAPKKAATTKKVKWEQDDPQEETRLPPNKRRKPSAAPSPDHPTIDLNNVAVATAAAVGVTSGGVVDESGQDQGPSLRRSKRVTRSSATAGQAAAVALATTTTTAKGAARKRNGTSGKRS